METSGGQAYDENGNRQNDKQCENGLT